MKYLVGIYNHADRGELAHILRLTIRGNEIYRALERTRTDSNAPLSAEIEAQGNEGDYSNQDEEETDGAGAVEPRDGSGDFDRDFDGVRDAVVLGDADGVGVVQRVPAIAVGGVPTVDIDRVGNAIPSSGGHLGSIAARRDGIPLRTPHSLNLAGTPLGRRHNAFGKTDGHAVADILADAIRSGINAKVSAVASVGRGHGDVAGGVAGEHRQGGSQEKELRR